MRVLFFDRCVQNEQKDYNCVFSSINLNVRQQCMSGNNSKK